MDLSPDVVGKESGSSLTTIWPALDGEMFSFRGDSEPYTVVSKLLQSDQYPTKLTLSRCLGRIEC